MSSGTKADYDVVIVGAGSAGCVLANRLSADPGRRVLLLEAGPRDWNPYIHIPAGFLKTFHDRSVNWLYTLEPGPWTNGRRILAPRGKTLGGSSAINGHVWNRGQSHDLNTWAQMGNRGWSYADLLPYFRRIENRKGEGFDPAFRGDRGELAVTDIDLRHPLCERFIEGAVSLGIPRNPDYNGREQEGISYAQRTIDRGRRVSTATAFLHPVRNRPNLHVETHAHATSLMLDGRRVTGVRYRKGGPNGTAREAGARQEVILSGGTYNSPQLLQLSGIGPPMLLGQHGVPVAHALPGVGEGLRDHFAPRFVARIKGIDTINERARGLKLGVEIARWFAGRPSILALSPTQVYCFWRSEPSVPISDIQLTFTPASYREGVQGELEREPGITVAAWQQRPESRGHVRIRSSDPFAAPLIQPNYLAEPGDRRVLLAAMKLARRLLATEPLRPFVEREDFPGAHVQTDDELLDVAKSRATTTFHPAGTCRMGPAGDPMAVVDSDLKVHGLAGLRVVDASVMPTMISANLNAATIAIADRASDLIRGLAPLDAAVPG